MSATLSLPMPGVDGHAAVLRALLRKVRRLWWLVLPVIALTLLATQSGKPQAVLMTFGISAGIALQLLWWAVATALMGQNDPLVAHLLPGHVRRLREVAAGVFLGIAALSGLFAGLAFGHMLAFMMGCAVAMLAFAACLRWPVLWFVFWVLPWLALPPMRNMGPVLDAVAFLRAWHLEQPLTQTAAVLLATGAGLWHLFQNGGDAHRRSWAAYHRLGKTFAASAGLPAPGAWTQGAGAPLSIFAPVTRFFQWAHPLWREHLLRSARLTPQSVAARAEFAALRGQHWSATMSTTLMIFALLLIAEIAVVMLAPDKARNVIQGALPGVSIGLMSAMLGPLFSLSGTLHQTRREQALLTLVPGMPRGETMNRLLAMRLLRQYLASWAVGVGMMLLLSLIGTGGIGTEEKPLLGLNFAAVALPVGLLAWRDWSRETPPTGVSVTVLTMAILAAMGLSVAVTMLWGVQPAWMVAGGVVATVLIGAWRWHALRRLPPFWPIGRNA